MANKFRPLRPDEIDCRVAQIKVDNGKPQYLSLLLYKDARCDQNILDEAVGPMNWKREHTRDNRNCIVSIWDDEKQQWIGKEDTGTESNTEKEKGLASDSFKRACFNWGIGRELYTAPFIKITADNCNITMRNTPKGQQPACYDHFSVKSIVYDEKKNRIIGLKIYNSKLKKMVFTWGQDAPPQDDIDKPEAEEDLPDEPQVTVTTTDKVPPIPWTATRAIKDWMNKHNVTTEKFKELRTALIAQKKVADKKTADLNEKECAALLSEAEKLL